MKTCVLYSEERQFFMGVMLKRLSLDVDLHCHFGVYDYIFQQASAKSRFNHRVLDLDFEL